MFHQIKLKLQHIPYQFTNISGDLTAGIILTFLILPQSMAYANIAGVPVMLGLYAGTFPVFIYALIGSSKYLSIGPVSIVSLLVFASISSMATPFSESYIEYVLFLSLLVGIVQLLMGVCKLGTIFQRISSSVISGFISSLALLIVFSQLDAITGMGTAPQQNFVFNVNQMIPNIHIPTTAIGFMSFIVLLILKQKFKSSPGPFIVILLSIIVTDFFHLDDIGVEIVGSIPLGLQHLTFQLPHLATLRLLLPDALLIGFISFFESFSIAKVLAEKEQEQLNSNRELLGLGMANMTGFFIGALPVGGAISRTAVNYESGARTKLSLLVTAFLMVLAIFYLTPLFYYLPKATLAAIIIFAVSRLINVKQFKFYLKNEPFQAVIFLCTFLSTLMLNVLSGLAIGIAISVVSNIVKRIN